MKNYINYVNEFQEGNEYGLFFIENNLDDTLSQDNIEHILDFLWRNKKKYTNISNKTILEKADSWNKKLIEKASKKDNEVEGVDYQVVKDFKDGFRFVKLISKKCYEREGKIMSHCVESYYGGNTNIYSLRDNKNMSHCTIEENNQIKGKGNGNINPKYVKYVVEFLEQLGMTIGDNEMKNIGYVNIERIKHELDLKETPLYNEIYLFEGNKEKLVDNKRLKYYSLKLLDYFDLITESLKINFDINALVDFEINGIKEINHSKNASSGDNSQNASSGNHSKNASSGYNSQNASSGNHSQNASSGDNSQTEMTGLKNVGAEIGINSKIKGVNGNWICLAQYNNNEIEYMKCGEIGKKYNGELLKENVLYKLDNKKFIEVIDI